MLVIRRLAAAVSLIFVLLAPVLVLGSAVHAAGATAVPSQIAPLDEPETEDPPGLGSIIGSPEAGPKPEDPGDRGGWAQLFLAVVVFGGVGFILTRIFRAANAATRE